MRHHRTCLVCIVIVLSLAVFVWAQAPNADPLTAVWQWLNFGQSGYALREARSALKLAPDDPEAHLVLAMLLENSGDNRQAEAEYRLAYPSEEDRPYLLTAVARLRLADEKWDEAAGLFRQALELDPGMNQAAYGLAQAQEEQGGRQEAIDGLRSLVERSPDYPEAFLLLGDLLELENTPSADLVELYDKAVESNPYELELRLRLARKLDEAGDRERARQEYAEILLLDADNAEAAQALK